MKFFCWGLFLYLMQTNFLDYSQRKDSNSELYCSGGGYG